MWRFFVLFLLFPFSLQAASLRLVPDSLPVLVGQPVTVVLLADVTDDVANAIEASIKYDEASLEFVETNDQNSRILFWINYPYACDSGLVCLGGIAPGGFLGSAQPVASITFIPTQAGITTITTESARLLRHDGKGTDIPTTSGSLVLMVEDRLGDEEVLHDSDRADIEPPEAFSPQIVVDPLLYDGKQVLIFETKDKQTKVATYYVKEYTYSFMAWLSPWREAQSPYVLVDQTLHSTIQVKAVDLVGNERVMFLQPTYPPSYWSILIVFGLLLGVILGLLRALFLRRRDRYIENSLLSS